MLDDYTEQEQEVIMREAHCWSLDCDGKSIAKVNEKDVWKVLIPLRSLKENE